eukprot:6414962-Alexandrium_andersonii.AAC.1
MTDSLDTWQHVQGLLNADVVGGIGVDTDVNMVPGGNGTGGPAVPLEDDHPFLAPRNPTAQQIMESSVS